MRILHYRRLLLTGVFVMLLATSLSSCKSVSIDESSNGKEVRVSQGSLLKITLDSNPTTGFEWELTSTSDTMVLEKVSNHYQSGVTLPGQVGAGGKEIWTFKALKKGQSTLYMEYSQPWDKGTKGAQKFSLTVVVE